MKLKLYIVIRKFNYLNLESSIFLYAHLRMIPNLSTKFHQHPLLYAVKEELRLQEVRIDGQTDIQTGDIYIPQT